MTWQPTANISTLQKRAEIIRLIRDFFYTRNIMEVETPLLCHTSVTDPYIESISAQLTPSQKHYLQTSPEYAMKRLLVAGSGPIYQICKAFRQDEVGRMHNPEFTMLEWYRPQFNHHDLMNEMDALLCLILKTQPAERYSYAELFETYLQLNPHETNLKILAHCANEHDLHIEASIHDTDTWLQLLMSHCIEPLLGQDRPCFVYDFPSSQAALARIQPGRPAVASRFEVYFKGIELANGFHELADATEQRKRFEENNMKRIAADLKPVPIDELFLAALEQGLPDCSGVALGIDRLIMLACDTSCIADVISFDINNA